MEAYLALAIAIVIAAAIAGGMIFLKSLLGPRRPSTVKGAPFECGSEPIGPPHVRLGVHFYAVAILFLVFDLEVAFFYPWAVVYRELGVAGFWAMLTFMGVLLSGLFYVWKKGVLDWGPRSS